MTSSSNAGLLAGVKAGAWIFIVLGLAFPLAVIAGLDAVTAFFLDLVFWPLDGAQSAAAPEVKLLASIAGGVVAGWGYTLLILARHGLTEQGSDGWAWRAAAGGLLLWFIADSAGSVASGAWANVISNLVFVSVIAVPLWLMRGGAAAKAVS